VRTKKRWLKKTVDQRLSYQKILQSGLGVGGEDDGSRKRGKSYRHQEKGGGGSGKKSKKNGSA